MYKNEFPLLKNSNLVYLDSAATTQKPKQVVDTINRYYNEQNANVHRALYPLGDKATQLYEQSRGYIKSFINAADDSEIIFTSGATESINLLAESFASTLNRGDRIILTEMEHHSNLVPWQVVAKKYNLELDFIKVDNNGRLDLDYIADICKKNTRLLSLTHISNLLGTINPIDEIISFAHKNGILVAVDAAQSVSRIPIDVQQVDCDFLVFSGHKIYGPTGIGILYGKKALLDSLPPYKSGGSMISSVSLKSSTWAQLPQKFEAGTPNITGAIGLAEAIKWVHSKGMKSLFEHEKKITQYAVKQLKSIENIQLFGTGENDQLGVVSFNILNIHAHDTVQFLTSKNLALRAGHHCAQPLINKLGVPSTVRASFAIYNEINDIDILIDVIKETIGFFKKQGVI